MHTAHSTQTSCAERTSVDSRFDANQLLPSIYAELRRLAKLHMQRLPAGSTLQPTALVHEAWMRLRSDDPDRWQCRRHFFAAAAETMRHIIIDRLRSRACLRHGAGLERVDIHELEIPIAHLEDDRLLTIDAALTRLAIDHPRIAELINLRFFVGFEIKEAALALGVSRATADRWWVFGRTWLYEAMHREDERPR